MTNSAMPSKSRRTILQSIIAPGLAFAAPEDMYLRFGNDKVRACLQTRRVLFKDGGRISFDTFFNGFSVDVWRRHCAIEDVALVLVGEGSFVVRLGLHRLGQAHRWLDEFTVALQAGEEHRAALTFWHLLSGGMLYVSVEADGPATLDGGFFDTATIPAQDVVLGIVITHFNRKQHLLPAIKRLQSDLLADRRFETEIVVVDNSRNIMPEETIGVTVIPNANFGGSGGFMRGLLYLKAARRATHCLFMDDDASCEVESIRRGYALLSLATTKNLAIAGSLLRALEPFRLHEKGALFDGMCKPQKNGLDMRDVLHLLLAEEVVRKPDYGGWWFFSFAIRDVEHYAFPFFVRGDDIQFSMANKFDICTMNGIASWGEDFGYKHGPLPTYLDVRNHLLQILWMQNGSRAKPLKLIARFFFLSAFSYNYASAEAVVLAVQDVASGPEFWVKNLDMSNRRALLTQNAAAERLLPIDRAAVLAEHHPNHEARIRRLLRLFTLNGFLLPSVSLKDAVVYQHKNFFASLRGVFRYKKILYEYQPLGIGYVAEHDKRRFFRGAARFTWEAAKFMIRIRTIKRMYAEALPGMTSEAFWRNLYADNQPMALQSGAARDQQELEFVSR